MSHFEEQMERLLDENKQLTFQVAKLSRELRANSNYIEKVTHTTKARENLGIALSAAGNRQRAYTEMLLQNCPNIILLLDDEGCFVLVTKAFLTVTGIRNFDFIKDRIYRDVLGEYMKPRCLERFVEAVDYVACADGHVQLNEWADFAQSGEERYYSIELTHIGGEKGEDVGISSGVLAVFVDLTDVMKEKQRAETASLAKSDFLAAMSHEIRTPMNAVLGMSEMLARSDLNETQRGYVSDMQKASRSLMSIINDILDFSKIEAGKMEIVENGFHLRALLDNLRSMFTLLLRDKEVDLHFQVDRRVPVWISSDENRLRQVLTNLLSNAVKYTSQGHVWFAVWVNKQGNLQFDIRDSGVGIREEDAERLFQPFEQLDSRKNKNVVGSGLGLSISRQLCRLMGGDLWFKSEYGKGSTFSVSLPCKPIDPVEMGLISTEPAEFKAPEAKVLVVDDLDINLSVAEAMLGAFDIQPDLALSGVRALQLVGRNEYDLIFMDHMMPDMDGIEAVRLIREMSDYGKRVPIVALTANAINGMEEMFLKNRFDGFLPKPISVVTMNRCLRKWLPTALVREAEPV